MFTQNVHIYHQLFLILFVIVQQVRQNTPTPTCQFQLGFKDFFIQNCFTNVFTEQISKSKLFLLEFTNNNSTQLLKVTNSIYNPFSYFSISFLIQMKFQRWIFCLKVKKQNLYKKNISILVNIVYYIMR